MKYFWIVFLLILYLYACGLYNYQPICHWKNPNIIVKKIKITDKISLVYYKNYEEDKERLGLCYKLKF